MDCALYNLSEVILGLRISVLQKDNFLLSDGVQCLRCAHWFRSRGGLAVNKCEILPEPELPLNNLFFVMIMAEVLGGLEI